MTEIKTAAFKTFELPDISFYQYKYDKNWIISQYVSFERMATKTGAVIIRAGQSTWVDSAFSVSWNGAKKAGLKRGSYFFYDSRTNPKRQAELWAKTLGDDPGELELWMDFEDKYSGPYHGHQHWYDFAERLRVLLPGKQLGVYTGYFYWLENTKPTDAYFSQYPLWIALYGNAPMLPAIWDDWLMWQYTDSGDGVSWGVASAEIDLNYRKGDIITATAPDMVANYGNVKVEYQESK